MTKKKRAGEPLCLGLNMSQLLQDERISGMISSYLDGGLTGEELAEVEQLLRDNQELAREVEDMRRMGEQLRLLGGDVLEEPIPQSLLDAVRRAFKD